MELFILLLLIIGFLLFVLAFIGIPAGRLSLIAGGLACWILAVLIEKWPG